MCDQDDVIGWRLETGESVLGFEPFGEGQVRMTKSPLPTPELGRTEHFPFSIVRTYPVQVTFKSQTKEMVLCVRVYVWMFCVCVHLFAFLDVHVSRGRIGPIFCLDSFP